MSAGGRGVTMAPEGHGAKRRNELMRRRATGRMPIAAHIHDMQDERGLLTAVPAEDGGCGRRGGISA